MASSAKKKLIHQKETEDSLGISRKKYDKTFSPNLFIIIKLSLVILIPVFYFIYSPALIILMILYSSLFYLARLSEKRLNKSIIKKNHIKIPKFDSAISLLLVVIAVFGTLISFTNKTKAGTFDHFSSGMVDSFFKDTTNTEPQPPSFGPGSGFPGHGPNFGQDNSNNSTNNEPVFTDDRFKQMKKQSTILKLKNGLINFGSIMTGERNIFSSNEFGNKKFNIGMKEPPSDFVTDSSELENSDNSETQKTEGGFNRGGKFNRNDINFSINSLPLEYTFSSAFSSISSILIFSVSFFGLISTLQLLIKRHKFNREMEEVILEDTIKLLDEKELERILSFGE